MSKEELMNNTTAKRLLQSIQLLKLDGYLDYTNKQLQQVSGVSKKTIQRNTDLIDMFDFALDKSGYDICTITI